MHRKSLAVIMIAAGALALLAVARYPMEPRWQADDPARGQHVTAMTWWQEGPVLASQDGDVQAHTGDGWESRAGLPADARSTVLLSVDGQLHAGTTDGILRLEDDTWNEAAGDDAPSGRIAHLTLDDDFLYAAGDAGIWQRPRDTADSWEFLGRPDEDAIVYRVLSSSHDGETLLRSGSIEAGVHRYDRDDDAWTAASDGLPEAVKVLSFQQLRNGTVLAGTDQGLFRQTTPDDDWQRVSGLIGDRRILSMAVTADTLYTGSDDGVWHAPLNNRGDIEHDADWLPVLAVEESLDAPVSWILTEGEQPWIAAGSAYRLRTGQPVEWYLLIIGGPLMLIAGGGLWIYRR